MPQYSNKLIDGRLTGLEGSLFARNKSDSPGDCRNSIEGTGGRPELSRLKAERHSRVAGSLTKRRRRWHNGPHSLKFICVGTPGIWVSNEKIGQFLLRLPRALARASYLAFSLKNEAEGADGTMAPTAWSSSASVRLVSKALFENIEYLFIFYYPSCLYWISQFVISIFMILKDLQTWSHNLWYQDYNSIIYNNIRTGTNSTSSLP